MKNVDTATVLGIIATCALALLIGLVAGSIQSDVNRNMAKWSAR